MSTFSGVQGKGAARRHREAKRAAAEQRHVASIELARTASKKRMCTKKNRYTTYDFALAVAAKACRREVLMRVYECPECAGFHLTKRPDRRVAS